MFGTQERKTKEWKKMQKWNRAKSRKLHDLKTHEQKLWGIWIAEKQKYHMCPRSKVPCFRT